MNEIPDFQEMMDLADDIGKLITRSEVLTVTIKEKEALTTTEFLTNPIYYENGKPASMSRIEATVKYTGFNNELIPLRMELAEVKGLLEKAQLCFEVFKMELQKWQTKSANERRATL